MLTVLGVPQHTSYSDTERVRIAGEISLRRKDSTHHEDCQIIIPECDRHGNFEIPVQNEIDELKKAGAVTTRNHSFYNILGRHLVVVIGHCNADPYEYRPYFEDIIPVSRLPRTIEACSDLFSRMAKVIWPTVWPELRSQNLMRGTRYDTEFYLKAMFWFESRHIALLRDYGKPIDELLAT